MRRKILTKLTFEKITEYEQTLLGGFILKKELFENISPKLNCSDFYKESHQIIYKAMINMKADNTPIDTLTLREFLEKQNELEEIGESSYITYLAEMYTDGIELEHYANTIKESSNKRKLWESLQHVIKDIENGQNSNIIEEKLNSLSEISISPLSDNINPISAADLVDIPVPESLWGDILYPSFITQLNAEPGAGKSTFAYNIAAHGALGKDFLDRSFLKTIKTLYVDLETPRSLCKQKIELICGELPENFYILDSLDLKKDFIKLLQKCKVDKYDLIVLDTQSRVFNMEQENDNSEANILMGNLRKLASDTQCAMLLLHHTTKGDTSKPAYSGRGASAIAASVDLVTNLKTLDKDTLELCVAKSRIPNNNRNMIIRKVGDDRFALQSNSNTFFVEQKTDFEKIQDLIISYLSDKNSESKSKDIHKHIGSKGFSKRNSEEALSGLVKSGKIEKPRHGIYSLPSKKSSANSATLDPGGTAEPAEKNKAEKFKSFLYNTDNLNNARYLN